jgi:hypothetical protein
MSAAIRDDGASGWRAAVVLVVAEILAIVGLTNGAAVYVGHRLIDKSSPFIFLVGFAILLINMPTVLGKNSRWNRLSTEFETYSTPTRVVGGIAVTLLVVGAAILAGHFGDAQRHLPR